jgi:hypothetical protein
MKHTFGKWYVEGTNPPRIYANEGIDIICQCDSHGEMSRAQELANAHLIASAPDLLNTCGLVLDLLLADGYGDSSITVQCLRAAITKAKGIK